MVVVYSSAEERREIINIQLSVIKFNGKVRSFDY